MANQFLASYSVAPDLSMMGMYCGKTQTVTSKVTLMKGL